ncbi:MAG: hypothetical protein RSA45_08100 [Hydrogenoanaerobacterium sp.]
MVYVGELVGVQGMPKLCGGYIGVLYSYSAESVPKLSPAVPECTAMLCVMNGSNEM